MFGDFINLLVSNISARQIKNSILNFRLEGARYSRFFSHFFAHRYLRLLALCLRRRWPYGGSERWLLLERLRGPSARYVEYIITSTTDTWTACAWAPWTPISYTASSHIHIIRWCCFSTLEHHLHVIWRSFALRIVMIGAIRGEVADDGPLLDLLRRGLGADVHLMTSRPIFF